jgi:hypothetical protein
MPGAADHALRCCFDILMQIGPGQIGIVEQDHSAFGLQGVSQRVSVRGWWYDRSAIMLAAKDEGGAKAKTAGPPNAAVERLVHLQVCDAVSLMVVCLRAPTCC